MGQQAHHNVGYGFEVPENIKVDGIGGTQEIWDLVEDSFPLLEFNVAGYYWNNASVQPSIIAIKSSMVEVYDYETIRINQIEHTSAELDELDKLKNMLGITSSDSWLAWIYTG